MTITGTNHGLSIYTDADASQRLLRPVEHVIVITNFFNDATTGNYYQHKSGHEGLDFGCGIGTAVQAMYGGRVIQVQPNDVGAYGRYVKIRSCTNPETKAGFDHAYAHLDSIQPILGAYVKKGQVIGRSGNTGGVVPHLHVHLQPFNAQGNVPEPYENQPAYEANTKYSERGLPNPCGVCRPWDRDW